MKTEVIFITVVFIIFTLMALAWLFGIILRNGNSTPASVVLGFFSGIAFLICLFGVLKDISE